MEYVSYLLWFLLQQLTICIAAGNLRRGRYCSKTKYIGRMNDDAWAHWLHLSFLMLLERNKKNQLSYSVALYSNLCTGVRNFQGEKIRAEADGNGNWFIAFSILTNGLGQQPNSLGKDNDCTKDIMICMMWSNANIRINCFFCFILTH